jgi:hypothetical protein
MNGSTPQQPRPYDENSMAKNSKRTGDTERRYISPLGATAESTTMKTSHDWNQFAYAKRQLSVQDIHELLTKLAEQAGERAENQNEAPAVDHKLLQGYVAGTLSPDQVGMVWQNCRRWTSWDDALSRLWTRAVR